MPTQKLNPEIIAAAIEGFEQQKLHIDGQIVQLRALLNGSPEEAAAPAEAPTGRRKGFSAATRRKMARAQKARWATKGESESPSETTPESPKRRGMSVAGRKAIAEA